MTSASGTAPLPARALLKPTRRRPCEMNPAEALKFAEKNGARMVDFKFVDLLGIWQHTTMPIAKLNVDVFRDGYFFDGSSIRGWQPIHASDMIFIPDPASAAMDPFYTMPTL